MKSTVISEPSGFPFYAKNVPFLCLAFTSLSLLLSAIKFLIPRKIIARKSAQTRVVERKELKSEIW